MHQGERFKTIAADALYEKLAMGEPFCLLDVRTESEYAASHIPGSVLIPLHELPGRVAEVLVHPGTQVEAGDLLIRFEG